MDDDIKTKANPNVVLVLDYLAVGVILAAMFYMSIVAKVVDPSVITTTLTGILVALGVVKMT